MKNAINHEAASGGNSFFNSSIFLSSWPLSHNARSRRLTDMTRSRRWFLFSAPLLPACARQVLSAENSEAPIVSRPSATAAPSAVPAAPIEPPVPTRAKPTPIELRRFQEALGAARKQNIARLAAYRRRAAFPQYYDRGFFGNEPEIAHRLLDREPMFIDEKGRSCAVAYLMQESGWGDQAKEIARTNVHVRVEEVSDGPLVEY